jgi:hypothetical protein
MMTEKAMDPVRVFVARVVVMKRQRGVAVASQEE